jgi:hypothetical protein
MKKLENLEDNSLNLNEMSIFNGGRSGDTNGGKIDGASYVCDYNQPDGSGTIYYPDESEWNPYKTN